MEIHIANLGQYVEIKGGETLAEILASLPPLGFDPICARVNNRTEPLCYQVFAPKQVEYVRPCHPGARRVYVRSLCMMLYRAVTLVHPGARLHLEHSIGAGHFCRLLDRAGTTIPPDTPALLEAMRDLVERDLPFERHERLTRDVIEIFRRQGLEGKVRLLTGLHNLYTTYYTLDGVADSYYGPLAPSTGKVGVFDLQPYREGMLLLPPDADTDKPAPALEQPKLYKAFTDHLRFNRIVGVHDVGGLNEAVACRRSADLINLAEALHSGQLARIAEEIEQSGARVVMLAGPSSSGKTTTCKRLAIQLMTRLLRPKMISLDDYFVDREKTPRDPQAGGDYDYEHLHALDLPLLRSHLLDLLQGKTVNLPTYSFTLGRRIEKERPLRLEPRDVLMLEGIHGLNPELLEGIPSGDVFRVYVSALTTLSIDSHNWISTTDTRLLRRIVRDHRYRGTSALDTLRRWPSVRRGEERWIFPFQERADAMFNSSLLFEIAVMKEYAEPLLRTVPHDAPEYSEAYRMLSFLSNFLPLPQDEIPPTSLLREFLGGSSFKY